MFLNYGLEVKVKLTNMIMHLSHVKFSYLDASDVLGKKLELIQAAVLIIESAQVIVRQENQGCM